MERSIRDSENGIKVLNEKKEFPKQKGWDQKLDP
jgi:hypothetical protein